MELLRPITAVFVGFLLAGELHAQAITRVSVSSNQVQANGDSGSPSISADGRYVAFHSVAGNIVPGDTLFVFDQLAFTTIGISVASNGTPANDDCFSPSISADGRYVAFVSAATNLVPGDTNGFYDVFVHDCVTGVTTRASIDSNGAQGNGDVDLDPPAISADGRYVAFSSAATNLVAGDTNGAADVFVRDLQAGTTTRVSVNSLGAQANNSSFSVSLSGDGRFVAFSSIANNLVAGDTNGKWDIFVRDLLNSVTTSVTCDPNWVIGDGNSFTPSLSADGRVLAFYSDSTNLVPGDTNQNGDVFVVDRQTGLLSRASVSSSGVQAQGFSQSPSISADGRFVAFYSNAANLVANDGNGLSDIFLHDNQTGITTRVNDLNPVGPEPDGYSTSPSISGDGHHVAFASNATNLVPGDTNGKTDVFVSDVIPPCGGFTTYCVAKVNSHGCLPWICAEGSPSYSGTDDFHVTAHHVLNNKTGILLWGYSQANHPFHGGTLCVGSFHRTSSQDSGGTVAVNDCTGAYSFFFSQAYMAAKGIPPGAVIYAQYWTRDPFYAPPNNIGLTNAIEFTVQP